LLAFKDSRPRSTEYVRADLLATTQRELAEARAERDEARAAWTNCKDLSKQGWSALSDARLFIANLGTPDDLQEALQCIDLAQASFADTIIGSEARAEASDRRIEALEKALRGMLQYPDKASRDQARAALTPDTAEERHDD